MKYSVIVLFAFLSLQAKAKGSYLEDKRTLETVTRALYLTYDLSDVVQELVYISNKSVYTYGRVDTAYYSILREKYGYHKNKIEEDFSETIYDYHDDLIPVLGSIDSIHSLIEENFRKTEKLNNLYRQEQPNNELNSPNSELNESSKKTVFNEMVEVLEYKINPLCNKIIVKLERIVIKYRTQFSENAEVLEANYCKKRNKKSKARKQNLDQILMQENNLNLYYSLQKFNNKLYFNGLSWLYRDDSSSRIEYTSLIFVNLYDDYKDINPIVINERLSLESILNKLNDLLFSAKSQIDQLQKPSDFEDPMLVFVCQDEFENTFSKNHSLVKTEIKSILLQGRESLNNELMSDNTTKTTLIRELINYNLENSKELMIMMGRDPSLVDFESIADKLIPVYASKFTYKEIEDILKYQKSKTGKKYRENSNDIFIETMIIMNRTISGN